KPTVETVIPENEPAEAEPEVEKPAENQVITESEPHAPEIKQEIPEKPTVETVIPENEPAEAEPEVAEKPAEDQVITESELPAPEIKQEIHEKPTLATVITENEPAEAEPEVEKPAEEQAITEIEPPAPEIKQEIHEKPTVETVITENEPAETEPEVPGKPKEEKAIPESEPPAPEIKPEVHEKPKEERAIPESELPAPEIKPEVAEKPAEEQAIPESEPAEKKQEVSDKPLEETVISESEDSEKLSDEMELSDDNVDEPETREKPETKEEIETQDIKPARKEKKGRKKKDDIEIQIEDQGASLEGAEELMSRLNMDDTRVLLRERLSPEKQAVFELLEEKLMSDVETRIKKLKEMQTKVLEETPPQTYFGKIKVFFTKEAESIEAYDPQLHGPLVTFDGMEGFTEVERYWVNEPYAFVVILFDPENNTYLYYAAEPMLTEFEDLFLREIKDRLKDVLLVEDVRIEDDKDKILTNKVRQLIKDYAIEINPLTLEKVLYYARRDYIKFGKIDPLMHDSRIEDVSANGHNIPIYLYHKKYTNIPTNIYYNENELNSYVIRLAQRCNKHISIAEPMVDATMPDGSRIQMTLGTQVTSRGATFTIRKFSEIPITPVDLINWNTFSADELAYLWLCIENNKSLIFAGGTASGKTSSLNAVSLFIPAQAKIVTLEDTRELKLPHPNWIPGVTRDSFTSDGKGSIDMYELLRAALRQRPEYLLVGEVRGKEALTLFQAMSTGHTTFSTMHADSVPSAIHRLENPPISVPRTMIQALNIISIQAQTYVGGKRARRNMKLVEITDIDPVTKNIRTNDIFVWDPLTDKFIRTGESKAVYEIMIRRGWSLQDMKKELMNRQKILEFMVNNKITDFNAISTIIHDYQATPEKIITKLKIDENG
ncbi:MAG TPA: ATPase, T2SS/T4P/T4SS family, partial [Candidatus Methanoperedens sp.]|nr:ATPase, T2SS/T4P/T4SS family [Candidatus Methanoperedens sp.]